MRRTALILGASLVMSCASCIRITEVPREEPPEPSDTMIVDGWDEVNEGVDIP